MQRVALSDLALSRPVSVSMVLVAVFLLGVIATFELPLAFMPTGQATRARVRVDISRSSPQVLEREVIRPLEDAVAGIRDTKRMRVSSGSWGVRADLEFETGTDIAARKLELRERIDRLRPQLPDIVQRIEISSSRGDADDPVLRLRVAGADDLGGRYYLLDDRVVRRLERLPGVALVELSGVAPHEVEVAVDADDLVRSGVDGEELPGAIRSAHRGQSMGVLRGPGRLQPGVRMPAGSVDPESIAKLPLRRARAALSTPLDDSPKSLTRIGEVADVSLHPAELRRGSRVNGLPAIDVDVYGDAGASAVDVSADVRRVLDEIAADESLGDIEVTVFRDRGEIILETLGDLRDTGIYGGIIGVVVLFAFLHRIGVTLTAALCIPLSVLSACGVLFMRGEELNCIVLLGLVLGVGMLIDNAVVIVESIQLQRRRGAPPLAAARQGAREVGMATVASTLSSVIVFLPLVLGSDANPMTQYLRPLGATFVTGLLASLFVSQTVVPLAMGLGSRGSATPTRHRVLVPLSRHYGRLLRTTLRFPRLTVLMGLAVSASVTVPAQQLNYALDEVDEKPEGLPVRLEMIGSSDYRRVVEHLAVMEQAVLARQDELGVEVVACEYRDWRGDCDIYPRKAMESEHEMSRFEAEIARALPVQPMVRYHLGDDANTWRARNRDPRVVNFVVRGEDMGVLYELSAQLAAFLQERLEAGDPRRPEEGGIDRVTGPFNDGGHEFLIHLDAARLQQVGLTAQAVAEAVSVAFNGVPLGEVQGPAGPVTLRLSSRSRGDGGVDALGLADVRNLRIRTALGGELPLAALAEFEEARSPYWVQRIDRQTEVRMSVRFFAPDAANRERVQRELDRFALPPGYSVGEGTDWWRRKGDEQEMLVNLGLCLVLVYAVMASLFESVWQPLAILVTCLLGCFGAPWAMWATETTVDTVALIGLFILIGIVVNNGIMLVDRITQLREVGLEREQAIRRAGEDRLRPILMTASTTVLGLVPMLVHHPTLAGVYYHSIAIIIAGGLVTSTLTSLVMLPAAYTWVEDTSRAVRSAWRRYAG
ncbi:MAG: efflux RND transporter permease subunit [Myxococcales bacterium FL481]|nr:MAG: efflux RND transporter permease subunit [Myxococcales bacterium FL481]